MAPFICGENGSIDKLHHVLWHVRFAVLMQLVHCKLRARDLWTVAPEPDVEPQIEYGMQRALNYEARIQT